MRIVPKDWPNLRSATAGAIVLTVIFTAQVWRDDGPREGFITGLLVAAASLGVIGVVWLIDHARGPRHPTT